jgi:aspartate/methionine/tyrosine aminotransferase
VAPRTRVIWINSPHNPTGAVFTAEEIAGIAELCRSRDLWLVSDGFLPAIAQPARSSLHRG